MLSTGGFLMFTCTDTSLRNDLFTLFGTTPQTLDGETIRSAYRRQALQCHPDRALSLGSSSEDLALRFHELQAAHERVYRAWQSGALPRLLKPVTNPVRPANTRPLATASVRLMHRSGLPHKSLRLGQYLYYSARIDWQTLVSALAWQRQSRPQLGQIARHHGLLDDAEILTILRSQQAGEFFGSTAARIGLLSRGNVHVCLGHQRLHDLPLGRYFVEQGIMGKQELERSLAALQLHNRRYRRP